MSAPEAALLPREPKPGSTLFAVPWHAEALGITNALIQNGMYSQVEWANSLAAEFRRLAISGEPDTEETYYQAVLAAVEGLVGEKSPDTGALLGDRVEAWRRAYLNTPHGHLVLSLRLLVQLSITSPTTMKTMTIVRSLVPGCECTSQPDRLYYGT